MLTISLFCFLASQAKGQNIPVFEYEVSYNLGAALYKTAYVFQYEKQVYFHTTPTVFLQQRDIFKVDKESGENQLNLTSYGDGSEYNILSISSQNRMSNASYANEIFNVTETNIKQKWRPTGKTKVIDSQSYPLFETEFRGRLYTAAVNTKIPFSYGPWKFNALPGLAVEISDSKKQLSWKLKGSKNTPLSEIKIFVDKQNAYIAGLKRLTLREFVNINDKTRGGFDVALSRLPTDYRSGGSEKKQRGGLELVFEWE